MPITSKDVLLVHTPEAAPPGWIEAATRRFHGLEVRWHSSGSGRRYDFESPDTLPREVLEGVTMMCLRVPPSPDNMRAVRFVQLRSSGADLFAGHEVFEDPRVEFCSVAGCNTPQLAEWVMATWLSHEHHFSKYAAQQQKKKWEMKMGEWPARDSFGRRIGIMGYGAIGRQVARLASALGMEVYAYTRSPRPTPESRRHAGYTVPDTGDPDGLIPARWFSGAARDAVDDFLAQDLDLLLLSLPLDESTRGLVGREQFEVLARGGRRTFVSNISRGPVVDTRALIEALEGGLISGAALDVQDPEPLPADHPLWEAPNVFITPHISWQSVGFHARMVEKLWKNLERLDNGEPRFDVIRKPGQEKEPLKL